MSDKLSDAVKTFTEKVKDPEYAKHAQELVRAHFKVQTMHREQQSVYAAVNEGLGIPLSFEFYPQAFGAYSANNRWDDPDDHRLLNEQIKISSMFYEILSNPRKYGVDYPELETVFVYLHELYHARFRHLNKQKILAQDFPLPHVVFNVVFDVFINTLAKYNGALIKQCRNDAKHILMYKNSMRYYESAEDFKESVDVAIAELESIGISSNEQDLKKKNILLNKKIESLSDSELAELVYKLFQDFFDKYQNLFEEAMEEVIQEEQQQQQQQQQGQQQGSQASEEEGDEAQAAGGEEEGEGQGEQEGEGEGEGESQAQSAGGSGSAQGQGQGQGKGQGKPKNFGEAEEGNETTDKIIERFMDKMKEESQKNPKFAEAAKKWMANFTKLPSPQIQAQIEASTKGGVMSPDEIAEAVRGRQAASDIIREIEEKNAGTVPGWMRSFADVKPQRPSYLAQLINFGNRHFGETKKTWSPPSKKRQGGKIMFPSDIGTAIDFAFVIDTSGSMSENEIGPVLGQMHAILRKAPPSSKLHVFFNDAQVQHEVLRGRNTTKLKSILEKGVQGGGGSVFNEVWDHPAMRKADVIVFLSDFYIFIPDTLRFRKPLVLLYTEMHNEELLQEIRSRARFNIAVPAGKLD